MRTGRVKRIYAAALLAGFVLTNIAGCLADPEEEARSQTASTEPKRQTITYCTWDDELVYTKKIVERFEEEHPNLSVNVIYNNGEMTAEQVSRLMEEEEIDIASLKDANDALYLNEQRQVTDITDWIPDSGINVSCYGNMYMNLSDAGRYYCLPYRKTCWALAYNPGIFLEEGIDFPGQMTWDEFAELAKQLTKGSGEEKQWGCLFGNWVCDFMGIQKKNYLYDDDLTYVQESLELLKRIYFEDKSSMTDQEIQETGWLGAFEQGNVAMMPMGEWLIGMTMEGENPEDTDTMAEYEFAPMPVSEDQKAGITWGTYQVVAVSTGCIERGKSEAAFEFLEFLCGANGAKLYAANGMLPAYMDEEIEDIYCKAIGSRNAEVFLDAYLIQENPVCSGYKELKDMLVEETKPLWQEEITVEEAIQNFEIRRNAYFEHKHK